MKKGGDATILQQDFILYGLRIQYNWNRIFFVRSTLRGLSGLRRNLYTSRSKGYGMSRLVALRIKNQFARCEYFTNRDLCREPVSRFCFPGPTTIADPKLFCEKHIQRLTWDTSKVLRFTIKRILADEEAL